MLVHLHHLNGGFALLTVIGGHVDNDLPGHGHPDNALPGAPVYPSQGLPGGPSYPSQGLPGAPVRPDNSLPTKPGAPDNTLPSPPNVGAGQTLVLVRGPAGNWHYAVLPPGVQQPTPLPTPPGSMPQPKG